MIITLVIVITNVIVNGQAAARVISYLLVIIIHILVCISCTSISINGLYILVIIITIIVPGGGRGNAAEPEAYHDEYYDDYYHDHNCICLLLLSL